MSVKLTKNELKKQNDSLRQFRRFLPTLILKKKQLQSVIRDYQVKRDKAVRDMEDLKSSMGDWIGVFGENPSFPVSIGEFVKVNGVKCITVNIAGVNVPDFDKVDFSISDYDLEVYPLWVDKGVEMIKRYLTLDALCSVYVKATALLEAELKTTTQRVNLFEKVKIPETLGNIRRIQVALQDQQTASVVKGKIAKSKLARKNIGAEAGACI